MAFNTSQATNDQSSLSKKTDLEENPSRQSSNMIAKNLRFSSGTSDEKVQAKI
jgi:predicted double-glycine peptidase